MNEIFNQYDWKHGYKARAKSGRKKIICKKGM